MTTRLAPAGCGAPWLSSSSTSSSWPADGPARLPLVRTRRLVNFSKQPHALALGARASESGDRENEAMRWTFALLMLAAAAPAFAADPPAAVDLSVYAGKHPLDPVNGV